MRRRLVLNSRQHEGPRLVPALAGSRWPKAWEAPRAETIPTSAGTPGRTSTRRGPSFAALRASHASRHYIRPMSQSAVSERMVIIA